MSAQDYVTEFNLSDKVIQLINAYKHEYPTFTKDSIIEWHNCLHSANKLRFFYFENIKAHLLSIPILDNQTSEKRILNIWISFVKKFNLYSIEDKKKILSDRSEGHSSYTISQFFSWSERGNKSYKEPKVLHFLNSLERTKIELKK